jgi:hypothetical protein
MLLRRSLVLFLSTHSLALCFRSSVNFRQLAFKKHFSTTSALQLRGGLESKPSMSTQAFGPDANVRVAYLHGFASSSESAKGVSLRNRMTELGLASIVETPDMNRPSFSSLTVSGALEVMDELHEAKGRPKWMLVGSSMGGYLAAVSISSRAALTYGCCLHILSPA